MDKYNNLTEREKEVLELIIQGKSNPQIANELILSIHTVKAHLESIYKKLGVHNKVQAAIFAVINNLIDVDEMD